MAGMATPELRVQSPSAPLSSTSLMVFGVRETAEGPEVVAAGEVPASVIEALVPLGVTGAEDEFVRIPGDNDIAAYGLIGLGRAEPGPVALRNATGAVTRLLRGVDDVVFGLPIASDDELIAALEGAALGSYRFDAFRSKTPDAAKRPVSTVTVRADTADAAAAIARADATAEGVALIRDLVNTPPQALYPESFVERILEVCEHLPVTIEVFDEAALAAGGFGGILGVGQGSARPPRLVRIEYAPTDAVRHLALVGKGITFDTGGLSLKPAASMVGMKYDMAGAATMLAVAVAAAKLSLPLRISTWLALAENMPAGTAIRPNDVLTIRGGTTVEVLNTDAEGRLVLADALVAAGEEQPDAIIDIATLTGAVQIALGDRHTGIMGDDTLAAELIAVGEHTGEEFWQLPLPSYLREIIRSDVADIANAKPGNRSGGTILAGLFLQEFVAHRDGDDSPRIPWLHLDIAATGNNEGSARGHLQKGPTGAGMLSLLALAEQISRA